MDSEGISNIGSADFGVGMGCSFRHRCGFRGDRSLVIGKFDLLEGGREGDLRYGRCKGEYSISRLSCIEIERID